MPIKITVVPGEAKKIPVDQSDVGSFMQHATFEEVFLFKISNRDYLWIDTQYGIISSHNNHEKSHAFLLPKGSGFAVRSDK